MFFEGFALTRALGPEPAEFRPAAARRLRPAAADAARQPADACHVARGGAGARRRFTVVCPDLRGYGGSLKPEATGRIMRPMPSARWRRTWSR